jgi:hypothetical protein
VLGAAAGAKGSLLNGQRRKPLGYGTDAEVAVASRNGLLVAGILGEAERNVGSLGVSLQTNTKGELPFLLLGEKEIAMGKVALLGLEGEMDMTVASVGILLCDLKNRLTEGEGIHAQKVAQGLGTGGAVGVDGGLAVPAEGGLDGCGHSHMVGKGLGIHTVRLL